MSIFKTVLKGVASGYVAIAVQTLVSVLLIPFLISERGLGLSGFGSLSALLATAALFSMLLDGWRSSCSHQLGRIKESRLPLLFLSFFLISGCLSGGLAAIAWELRDALLAMSGQSQVIAVSSAFTLVLVLFALEQTGWCAEVILHRKQKTWLVNLTQATEVVLRAIAIVFVFINYEASILAYLQVQVLVYALRVFVLLLGVGLFLDWRIHDRERLINDIRDTFRYGFGLSLKGISNFIFFRGTLLFVNRIWGAETAGIFSIVLVTIRTYVIQALFAVLQPMIIPLTAGVNLASLEEAKKDQVLKFIRLFQGGAGLAVLSAAISTPVWLPLWLGEGMVPYLQWVVLGLLVFGVEVIAGIPTYLVVSQGQGTRLSVVSLTLCIPYILCMAAIAFWGGAPVLVLVSSGIFLLLMRVVIVPRIFHQRVILTGRYETSICSLILTGLFLPLVFQVSSDASYWVGLFLIVAYFFLYHHFVLTYRQIIDLIETSSRIMKTGVS